MGKLVNSTDLHIQYRMSTGKYHLWEKESPYPPFYSTEGYSREYCKWVEEQYLNTVNKEKELEKALETIEELEIKIGDLEDEIESLREQLAGEDL